MNSKPNFYLTFAVLMVSLAACGEPDKVTNPAPAQQQSVPVEEQSKISTDTPVFIEPETPAWVTERRFETIDVNDENKNEILKSGIAYFTKKNYVQAYPYLDAAAKNGQKVSHLYLGLNFNEFRRSVLPKRGSLPLL